MLSVVLNVHRSSACRLVRYRSWTVSWRIWCPDPVRKPSGWWPERWRRTPTSTRIKPWQARGKSWSAASTAFWTPCKSHTGLADQVYTHIQDASFCEHHVGAFVGSLSEFCRMCVWLWKRFFFLCFKLLNVRCSLHYHSPANCFLFTIICSFWSRILI